MGAYGILLIGESGTGKSFSMKNLEPTETAIINVQGKPLPFKGGKRFTNNITVNDIERVTNTLLECASQPFKNIILDDMQYLILNYYTSEITGLPKAKKYDKYDDLGASMMGLFNVVAQLRDDQKVVFMFHEDEYEGKVDVKIPCGRFIQEKIDPKGMFTMTLRTVIKEGHYYFQTQNDGSDICKSPEGVFDNKLIPNDLNEVFKAIDAYEYGEPDVPQKTQFTTAQSTPVQQPAETKQAQPVQHVQPVVPVEEKPVAPVEQVNPVETTPIPQNNGGDGISVIITKFGSEENALSWLISNGAINKVGSLSELPVNVIDWIVGNLGSVNL